MENWRNLASGVRLFMLLWCIARYILSNHASPQFGFLSDAQHSFASMVHMRRAVCSFQLLASFSFLCSGPTACSMASAPMATSVGHMWAFVRFVRRIGLRWV